MDFQKLFDAFMKNNGREPNFQEIMELEGLWHIVALKELYNPSTIQNLIYEDNPLIKLIPKLDDFEGASVSIPLKHKK